MGLKEDAKFARYITMGAIGAAEITADLSTHGHNVVELERYAMANKIWSTKVKRLRMADLICLCCGRRFEAKSKSKLEIKLSDSTKVGRGWAEGMRPTDVFAFIQVAVDVDGALTKLGRPFYFETASLELVTPKEGPRKSAADGAERDVSWSITVSKSSGTVEAQRGGRYKVQWDGDRASTVGIETYVGLVSTGDRIVEGQVIASSATPLVNLECAGPTWDIAVSLSSSDEVEVFAAVKAIGLLGRTDLRDGVAAIADDSDRDLRLRIEAWGALAQMGSRAAISSLAELDASPGDEAMQMERVLVLSELTNLRSAGDELLLAASNRSLSSEIRAAAVWGLGSAWHDRFLDVWPFVDDNDSTVSLHAQACLGVPGRDGVAVLADDLKEGKRAPLAAAVLARHGHLDVLLNAARDPARAGWAIQGLGQIEGVPLVPFKDLSQAQAAAVVALTIRNRFDTHNEATHRTEMQFLSSQNLHGPNASSVTVAITT